MILGISHQSAFEIWQWIEVGFFASFVFGLCLILAKDLKWFWWGIGLTFTSWFVWVIAYDIADGYRNVNQ